MNIFLFNADNTEKARRNAESLLCALCAFSSPSNTTTESPLPATGASQVPDWNPGACLTPGTTVSRGDHWKIVNRPS